MNMEEINQKLAEHAKWLNTAGGERINLQFADLRCAGLQGADLQFADLRGADLRGAGLQGADLQGADLRGADLRGAGLQGADLQGADLRRAFLPSRYIQIACIGSRRDVTTYSFAEDKIWCGCFKGTLKEFKEQVLKTYPQAGGHQAEYLGLIAYIEALQKEKSPEIV